MSFGGKYATRDKALFLLGVKSGFRISELLSLRLCDVLQAGRMIDRITVQRRHMKKKTESRAVLLHPEAKEALAEWINELNANGHIAADTFVFRSRKGRNRPVTRMHAWRILKEAYGSNEMTGKLGTYSMRKTFADRIYDKLDGIWSRRKKPLVIGISIQRSSI